MKALSNSDFLGLWERGWGLHPLDQALLTLSAALPENSYETLSEWPLGRRNQALAELWCRHFGSVLECAVSCERCGEKLEFEMDGTSLLKEEETDQTRAIVVNGKAFRLPTSRDLARVVSQTDPRSAVLRLLESCRVASANEEDLPPCSEEEVEEIGRQMAAADPMAENRLMLHCPACGHDWEQLLDMAAFLWTEIEARGKRLVWEIHAIASSYGWTEKEILSLPERRRVLYLGMVQA